ncbi:glycogen/starch/alpha-glucan phosphorylase, partial [Pseudomonas aeruginosa]|uniref:glycogen/starch/alpha-glucan phosphorylase n=1 Tax=Pseudomonas aeruginosa TaxID=287 RepID=UPI00188D0B3F
MALLERGLKQRIVGALVLIALAVIFLPMLFTREDESRQVVVEAPPRPQAPAMPSVEVQPTEVPELQPGEEDIAPEIVEEGQELRLRQEYFFVSASLQDLLDRHLR